MPRLRHVILFFLCLLACATQVQANWVTHSNYKFTGKERNVETDSKPNECLHLQFGAAENAYFALLKWTSGWMTAAKKRRHWQTNGLLVI